MLKGLKETRGKEQKKIKRIISQYTENINKDIKIANRKKGIMVNACENPGAFIHSLMYIFNEHPFLMHCKYKYE